MVRITLDQGLSSAVPHKHATVLHLEGESIWSVRGAHWSTRPGTLGVKVPGEVYREHTRRGRSRFQVVVFEDALVEEARAAFDQPPAAPRAGSFDGFDDPRVQPLMVLHQGMLDDAACTATLEQALAEALATYVQLTAAKPSHPEPASMFGSAVARARALLDTRITEPVTLDELAAHARLDKFRLCRAFREQVGLPPHAYVTHRRVSLAQEMLARGVPQAEVAIQVGLYDQSQLHRHFKRILGITPGAWARAMR
ncbi:MAG: helix-turn-helix transcriptional regulator [Deltaproteobacteria bacterium]|nr:helix-turn-helix transcriptional regulator [Deltaproteobacteria bacterium]